MAYFKDFPTTLYYFGNEDEVVSFQDISTYVEIIDTIKDESAFYTKYYIQDNERPDQLSFKLYGTPEFHWTFFLLNDNIREQGWPMSNTEIVEYAQKELSKDVITTKSVLTDKTVMLNGNTIVGTRGGTATIDHRHLDLGQLVLTNVSGNFLAGEQVRSAETNEDGELETIIVESYGVEYLSAHHYEDGNELHADIDPTVGPGALLSEVTHLDRYIRLNNKLKEIKIIKPTSIFEVVELFNEALRS